MKTYDVTWRLGSQVTYTAGFSTVKRASDYVNAQTDLLAEGWTWEIISRD